MSVIYNPPGSHDTITSRFSAAEFKAAGIEIASDPSEASVIVAALAEELAPLVKQFGGRKRYLIWCDEPLWSHMFQCFPAARTRIGNPAPSGPDDRVLNIDAMNCFTGDVFFSNHHFLNKGYHLTLERFRKEISGGVVDHSKRPSKGKIAAFLTYRNSKRWDFVHPTGGQALNNLRTRLALEGRIFNKVDVYGQGWPQGLVTAEDRGGRDGRDPFDLKLEYYRNYQFAVAIENVWSPYWVTEKIWHPILVGCLPIYYAGPQHTIYRDFPAGSFVDYFDFRDPSALFEFLEGMSGEEFERRMILCRIALEQALYRSMDGETTRTIQMQMFAHRVGNLVWESHNSGPSV